MFIGIQEEVSTRDDEENSTVSSQNTENTKEIIYNFMEQELQIQNARNNWIPTPSPSRERERKEIVTHHRKVPSYCDCEEILFKGRKLLKDKTYSAFEDMPKEVYELRKAQFKKLQNAKERGDTAYFSKKISR